MVFWNQVYTILKSDLPSLFFQIYNNNLRAPATGFPNFLKIENIFLTLNDHINDKTFSLIYRPTPI